ncbi:MAG TPA: hypothetical protein VHP11_06710 [Tepidisphaeraceae bacterium]|nr:hypothetical protein [Tepidisphaeraceae bacterium]
MQTSKFKIIGATLVILGAVVFLYLSMSPSAPIVEHRPFEALGQVAAEEAQKLIGNRGRIALITRDTDLYPNPQMDYICDAFYKAAAQMKLTLVSTNRLKIDPLNATRVPLGDYQALFMKLSERDVIVSLMGPPPVTSPEDRAKIPEKRPKVVALCLGTIPRQINLRALFAQNLLHTAIINRPNPETALPKSGDPHAWFDHFYEIMTPSNQNDLPASTEIASLDL